MSTDAIIRGETELRRCLGEAEGGLVSAKARAGELAAFEIKLPVDYLGMERTLRVSFGESFPDLPATFSVLPWPTLEWPHVMTGGLCLHAEDEQPLNDTPEASISYSFSQFSALLQFNLSHSDETARRCEFQKEIRSYWALQIPTAEHRLTLISIPNGSGPLDVVSDRPGMQRQNLRYLAAPEHSQINAFEKRQGRQHVQSRATAKAGYFLKLVETPPPRLPAPNSDLISWLMPSIEPSELVEFQSWLDETRDLGARWIVVSLPTEDIALEAFYVTAPGMNSKTRRVFGRRTQRRQTWRAQKPSALSRVPIDVLDAMVIHQRGGQAAAKLSEKKVVLVGAGSLGGELAVTLARAGVGMLVLVDPDLLEDVNVGRHVLGASDLGRPKVIALADRIRKDIPTTEVVAIPKAVQATTGGLATHFGDADLVLVTTANWPSEAYLWALKAAGSEWSLIQAWSEPHALVGHALIAPKGSYDGRYLFERGNFRHLKSDWPSNGVIPLPACGQSYIPASGANLSRIVSMIAACALRALANPPDVPTWHFTVGGLEQIEELEGTYTGPSLPAGQCFIECVQEWPP